MKKRNLLIIMFVVIIIMALTLTLTKEEVKLDVHAERISNSSEFYLVSQIKDINDNPVDTNFGKLSVEFIEDESSSIIMEEMPVEHGKLVIRHYGGPYKINVHYDGGYFYKPCDYSDDLLIINDTQLSDENITRIF